MSIKNKLLVTGVVTLGNVILFCFITSDPPQMQEFIARMAIIAGVIGVLMMWVMERRKS